MNRNDWVTFADRDEARGIEVQDRTEDERVEHLREAVGPENDDPISRTCAAEQERYAIGLNDHEGSKLTVS